MASHDSEDDDLKAAIAMSLAEQESKPRNHLSSILGDRAAMEEDRLARLARKRGRSISPPVQRSRKAPKLEETTVNMESGARLKMFSSIVHQDQESRKPDTANAAVSKMKVETSPTRIKQESLSPSTNEPNSCSGSTMKYPQGVIKKTWAFRHDRDGHDVKLEEVLEASSLRTAVLSAFQWDVEWVLSKLKTPLNGGSTKCIFIMQAKGREERDRMREEASDMSSFLRLCFPPIYEPIWCMHSKLMLLFHSEKLRIAIPSANLLNFDWGETGQMENSVFMIDLPRLAQACVPDDLTFFGRELMLYVEKQGLDQDVRNGLLNFDFSATTNMAFIHTIGGVHYKDIAERTGLLGLARSITHLNLSTKTDTLELDFAASSIGQLNTKYLQDLIASASGADLVATATQEKSKAAAGFFKKGAPSTSTPSVNIKNVRVYFPTEETVQRSTAGSAGTICLQRRYFEARTFPRDCFRDYKSTRAGLLSHNKILCARGKRNNGSNVAWVYHGSANMSKSAWGELPADRTQTKITCRNWECGVLMPVPAEQLLTNRDKIKAEAAASGEDAETASEDEGDGEGVVGFDVFKPCIDLPFQAPGDEYNGREPWYFTEEH